MKKTYLLSYRVLALSAVVVGMPSLAADLKAVEVQNIAASGVAATRSGGTTKVVNVPKATTAGSIATKNGDNQYPSGQLPIPPKPKKDGLEAAGAIKAQAGKAAQP